MKYCSCAVVNVAYRMSYVDSAQFMLKVKASKQPGMHAAIHDNNIMHEDVNAIQAHSDA